MLLACAAATAQTRGVVGELAVGSDLTDHGIVIGARQPVAQASLTLYDTSGWSTGLAVAVQDNTPNPHRILARAAYDWVLSNEWQAQVGALYYSYPSNTALQAFDHLEIGATWSYRDLLVLGLSTSQYRHSADNPVPTQWAADVALRWPLGGQVAFSAGVGQAQLGGNGGYGYGNLGLAWHQGVWRAELNYLTTDERGRTLYGNNPAGHWSLLVARTF